MFASNRAVYNKLVAQSRDDRMTRLAQGNKESRMTLTQLTRKYRSISEAGKMALYFRRKSLRRHREVNSEVRDSAFQDFKSAVKSSLALYFKLKKEGKPTTFPELSYRSKFARSNSIAIRTRSIFIIHGNTTHGTRDLLRFHSKFFEFGYSDGIEVRECLPLLEHSVRLQRLRDGSYYLAIPRHVEFKPSNTTRVCSIDPGVRNFVTIYDPDGRTLSVKDSYTVLKRRFDVIDKLKSRLALLDNESKAKHKQMPRQRTKQRKRRKTKKHRERQRIRRQIHLINQKVTRMVKDMHQKISSWLAQNYDQVLLPSFNTSEMVAKYEKQVAAEGAPTASLKIPAPATTRKGCKKQRKIRSATARSMMAQSHFKFKQLLSYKMARAGGRAIVCSEEYTSKTCSRCGKIKNNLGGSATYRCTNSDSQMGCGAFLDRDINAAKNIFHMNVQLLV